MGTSKGMIQFYRDGEVRRLLGSVMSEADVENALCTGKVNPSAFKYWNFIKGLPEEERAIFAAMACAFAESVELLMKAD
jgi:hypothetical protein